VTIIDNRVALYTTAYTVYDRLWSDAADRSWWHCEAFSSSSSIIESQRNVPYCTAMKCRMHHAYSSTLLDCMPWHRASTVRNRQKFGAKRSNRVSRVSIGLKLVL